MAKVLDDTYKLLERVSGTDEQRLKDFYANPLYDRLKSSKMWAHFKPRLTLMRITAQKLEPNCPDDQWDECIKTLYGMRENIGAQLEEAQQQYFLMETTYEEFPDAEFAIVTEYQDAWADDLPQIEPYGEHEPPAQPEPPAQKPDPFEQAKRRMRGDNPELN